MIIAFILLGGCGGEDDSPEHISFSFYAPDYGITNYRVRLEKNLTNGSFGSEAEVPAALFTNLSGYPICTMSATSAPAYELTTNVDAAIFLFLPGFERGTVGMTMLLLSNRIMTDLGIAFPMMITAQGASLSNTNCWWRLDAAGDTGERVSGSFHIEMAAQNMILSNGIFSVMRN